MCCFSRPVQMVGSTRIFARLSGKGTQYLVYEMVYSASEPLAMILPLPVALPSRENAVTFISMQNMGGFFRTVESAFVVPSRGVVTKRSSTRRPTASLTLKVHEVGDYVASFVPTMQDFKRLDKRFVIPASTWNKIPAYRDYGFAVFQLKANSQATPHPMAFEFPTRIPDRLFFPTVHIHDGQVHPTEDFDHALYAQVANGPAALETVRVRMPWNKDTVTWSGDAWKISYRSLHSIPLAKPEVAALIQPDAAVYRRILKGNLPNQDTLLRPSG